MRRATLPTSIHHSSQLISIHALLAESDPNPKIRLSLTIMISIHALLAESDVVNALKLTDTMLFLSTLSLRRATSRLHYSDLSRLRFLSTLSLRRATWLRCWKLAARDISIHALLAESDVTDAINGCNPDFISIHALLAESDNCTSIGRPKRLYFYPRSPCGERPNSQKEKNTGHEFLSTLSLRRATVARQWDDQNGYISIHALLAESDHDGRVNLFRFKHFYPRSPCGERRC